MLDALRTAVFRREARRSPAPLPDEVALFADADAFLDAHPAFDPSAEALRGLARLHGLDLASAVFCRAMRRRHAALADALDAPRPAAPPRLAGTLVVVPAPHYDRLPGYGGDGALVRRVAHAFGLATRLVPLPAYGRLGDNADRIADALSRLDGPLWIASLSKGSADVRTLLGRHPDVSSRLARWLSIGGIVGGTSLLARASRWERRAAALLAGTSVQALDDLSADGPLGAPWTCPVPTLSLVPCPTEAHTMTPAAHARYRRLAPLGPNDGACLLPEAVVPGHPVVPVWGVDHYVRHPHAAGLLYRLFAALATRLPSPTP